MRSSRLAIERSSVTWAMPLSTSTIPRRRTSLRCDGIVEDRRNPRPEADADIIWIAADDQEGLRTFLLGTPRLSPWQQLQLMPIGELMSTAWAMLVAILVFAGAGWLLESLARLLWHVVRG